MKLVKCALTLVVVGFAPSLYPSDGSDVWTKAKPFNKSLADGPLHAPLVDPLSPPPIDLFSLLWNGQHLKASADYYDLATLPTRVEGRDINNSIGVTYFHPYAKLQISDEMKGPWKTIGESPASNLGTAATVVMLPNAPKVRKFPHNAFCMFDMDPFRPWVQKAKYGRVVLRGGEESQVIALVDLLPP
jgi:hypothetical protein